MNKYENPLRLLKLSEYDKKRLMVNFTERSATERREHEAGFKRCFAIHTIKVTKGRGKAKPKVKTEDLKQWLSENRDWIIDYCLYLGAEEMEVEFLQAYDEEDKE